MKAVIERIKSLREKPMRLCAVVAILINIYIEVWARHSLWQAAVHIITSPVVFLFNALIIMSTLMIGMFFKRRMFALSIISAVWMILGTINGVLLMFRTFPLLGDDFRKLASIYTILGRYMNVFEMVLISLAAVLLIACFVRFFIKAKKYDVRYKHAIITFVVTIVVLAVSWNGLVSLGVVIDKFTDLPHDYKNYGFPYCFTASVTNTGIDEPDDYTEDSVNYVLGAIDAKNTKTPAGKPNVIFMQLETFYDANYFENYVFSENPVPYWQELKKNYSSGYLQVPVIGAGTANTEFEVISGMSLEYFGPGEYPYKTILNDTTCESMCYNYKELGYATHAIHNNTATFYGRNKVFPQLGFDTFTSIEFMQDIEYNENNWCKDKVFIPEVLKAMQSTDNEDLIYGITVQCHGKYPTQDPETERPIVVAAKKETAQADLNQMSYYINELKREDDFLRDFLKALEDYDEDVVVVMYGDHLPALNFEDEDITTGNRYDSEYVIWSNFDMDKQDNNLYTYQLSSEVMSRLGMNNGVLTKLHQKKIAANISNDQYKNYLNILQYDMLYGGHFSFGGRNPYYATQIQLGVEPMQVAKVTEKDGRIYIYGSGFTTFSHVYVDGNEVESVLEDYNTLSFEKGDFDNNKSVIVKQLTSTGVTLEETEPYSITPKVEEG